MNSEAVAPLLMKIPIFPSNVRHVREKFFTCTWEFAFSQSISNSVVHCEDIRYVALNNNDVILCCDVIAAKKNEHFSLD